MWTIFIPYLAEHLYEFFKTGKIPQTTKPHLWLLSIWAFSCFSLSPSLKICVWIPFAAYQWILWVLSFRWGIQPSFSLLSFLSHPRSFLDSIKELRLAPYILLGTLLIGLSCLDLSHGPPQAVWLVLAICLFPLKKRGKALSAEPLLFPYEQTIPVSPHYPALRTTVSFLGDKTIHIPIGEKEKPHLIFVFLESFRAANVGVLGAKHPASPHFDAWAKRGILFRNFRVTGQQTFRAFISAYFGIPGHLPTMSLKPFCNFPMYGLPQILKKEGYENALIQSGDVSFDYIHPFFKSHGFTTILGAESFLPPRFNSWGVDDHLCFQKAADFLAKQLSPTFLSIFTINNHHPWQAPPHWKFPVDPQLPSYYQKFLQTFSYTDHALGHFLETLEEKNLLSRSILFIMGDHGQNMGENQALRDLNQGLLEEQIHVPLLILAEGRNVLPSMEDKEASLLDLPLTVLDLFNLKATHHSLGKSLLRNIESPSFFSLWKKEATLGSVFKQRKQIFGKEGNQEFNLQDDPEEKRGAPLTRDLAGCQPFFDRVNQLYQTKQWAPPFQKETPYQIKASAHMDDAAWLKTLKKAPPSPSVHLNSAPKLTDKSFLLAPPLHAKQWHELILTNCTLLTDQSLLWIGKHCPELISLSLSHCHLITDQGVQEALKGCLNLQHLYLDGMEDLECCIPEERALSLRTCSLLDLPKLRFKTLWSLFAKGENLLDWSASLSHFTDAEMRSLADFNKKTVRMHLTHGEQISDQTMNALFAAQPNLQELYLEDFPLLEFPDFSKLSQLKSLTLIDCPRLNSSCLQAIKELPLLYCNLPKIFQNFVF